MVVKLTKYTRR